jgi:hypothetical protein
MASALAEWLGRAHAAGDRKVARIALAALSALMDETTHPTRRRLMLPLWSTSSTEGQRPGLHVLHLDGRPRRSPRRR